MLLLLQNLADLYFIILYINDINYILLLLLSSLIRSLLGCLRSFLDNFSSLSGATSLIAIMHWSRTPVTGPLHEVKPCNLLKMSLMLAALPHLWCSPRWCPDGMCGSLVIQAACLDHLFPGVHVLFSAAPCLSACVLS